MKKKVAAMTEPARHYVTLFDGAYAIKGVLMIDSLRAWSSCKTSVHVLVLDDEAEAAVRAWFGKEVAPWTGHECNGFRVWIHRAADLLPEMLALKATRDHASWCWTLASNFTLRVMRAIYPLESVSSRAPAKQAWVTYLDADLFFYGDPEECHRTAGDGIVSVVPHRFPPAYASYIVNGRFNVSWVGFRFSAEPLLDTWAAQCREHCDRTTCGDQRYLDAWPAKLGDKLAVLAPVGMGAGPWNLWSYALSRDTGRITLDGSPLTFYHFHEHRRDKANPVGFRRTLGYPLRQADVDFVYASYEDKYKGFEALLDVAKCV